MSAVKTEKYPVEKEEGGGVMCVGINRLDNGDCTDDMFSPSPDLQENRRMIRKKDLVHILFLYLCFASVCPAYPCGEDPLRKLYSYAKATGQVPEAVLQNIRFQDPPRYRFIVQGHKTYDECVIRVETGSFKRSGTDQNPPAGPMSRLLHPESFTLEHNDNSFDHKRRPFYFLPKVSRRSWNYPGFRPYPRYRHYIFGRTHFSSKDKQPVRSDRFRRIFPIYEAYMNHN